MNLQGTQTGRISGRYHSLAPIYNTSLKQWQSRLVRQLQSAPRYVSMDWARVYRHGAFAGWMKKIARKKIADDRLARFSQKAFDKRMKMKRRYAIEGLVRRKNSTYAKWRSEHDFPALDDACTECMLRFGKLPHWEEFILARRGQRWSVAEELQREHSAWKKEVRKWALEKGLSRFPMQSAQFLKFYFAWWRYEHESRNGPITRPYGRQMG